VSLNVLVLDQARGVWGAQRYLLRLAPLLREHGIELFLGCPAELELYDAWRAAGFVAFDLDLPIIRSIRNDGRPRMSDIVREAASGLRAAGLIATLAVRNHVDAIWANAHWIHVEASLAGRLTGKPVVLHLHEEAIPGLGQQIRTSAVRLAPRTVAVSKAIANGLPVNARHRVDVIPNSVDTALMSPSSGEDSSTALRAELGVGPGEVMVLAATRLDPVKRIEDLIEAVRCVSDARIHLVIAGETSWFPDYARAMQSAAESVTVGRVTFCGLRSDMPGLFRAADIVLHAGVVEGMPLGLIEAQSCGTPVVAYAVAGVPEAVMDGITGILVPADDVAGLAAALAKLAADPEVRSGMGAAARQHVVAHHRIELQALRNAKVIYDMCGAGAGRRDEPG
jgi:glycosyltransferase involved in cell wall biosynthesis